MIFIPNEHLNFPRMVVNGYWVNRRGYCYGQYGVLTLGGGDWLRVHSGGEEPLWSLMGKRRGKLRLVHRSPTYVHNLRANLYAPY